MVVVDRLSKVAHFIAVKYTNSVSEGAQIFFKVIVRLHGVPEKIISDRDAKFTSRLWKELFACLRIELDFITTYHPGIFLCFKNLFAGNLCIGLKPTFGIRVVSASRGHLCC